MAALLPVELAAAIETLVEKLAARRFEEVENSGESGLLTAEELRREFSYYPRAIVPLGPGWQQFTWRYDVRHSDIVAIEVDLWTAEDGRSDLTLSVDAKREDGEWALAITGLRVM